MCILLQSVKEGVKLGAHTMALSALRVDVVGCCSVDVRAFDQHGNGSLRVDVRRRCNVGGGRFGGRALRTTLSRSGGKNAAVRGVVVPVRSSSVVKTEVTGEVGEVEVKRSTVGAVGAEVTRLERAVELERGFQVDTRIERELKDGGGFRGVRRTKLVATIGPSCCTYEQLEALASSGVNVARLNMCHGTHEWHRQAIRNCRRLNAEKGYGIVVMIDTEGSEIHMGDLGGLSSAKAEVCCILVRRFRIFSLFVAEGLSKERHLLSSFGCEGWGRVVFHREEVQRFVTCLHSASQLRRLC